MNGSKRAIDLSKAILPLVALAAVACLAASLAGKGLEWLAGVGFFLLGVAATYQFIRWRNDEFDKIHATLYRVEPRPVATDEPVPAQADAESRVPPVDVSLPPSSASEPAPMDSTDWSPDAGGADERLSLGEPDVDVRTAESATATPLDLVEPKDQTCAGLETSTPFGLGFRVESAAGPEQSMPTEFALGFAAVDPALSGEVPTLHVAAPTESEVIPMSADIPAEKRPAETPEAANRDNAAPAPCEPPRACPKCGAKLHLKTVKKGPNAGSQYWGCSTYPACRYRLRVLPKAA